MLLKYDNIECSILKISRDLITYSIYQNLKVIKSLLILSIEHSIYHILITYTKIYIYIYVKNLHYLEKNIFIDLKKNNFENLSKKLPF